MVSEVVLERKIGFCLRGVCFHGDSCFEREGVFLEGWNFIENKIKKLSAPLYSALQFVFGCFSSTVVVRFKSTPPVSHVSGGHRWELTVPRSRSFGSRVLEDQRQGKVDSCLCEVLKSEKYCKHKSLDNIEIQRDWPSFKSYKLHWNWPTWRLRSALRSARRPFGLFTGWDVGHLHAGSTLRVFLGGP